MNRTLSTVFIALFLFCGCDKLPFGKKSAPKVEPTAAVEATIAETKEEPKISGALLARVGDWAIGADDFKNYLNTLKDVAQAQGYDINNAEFKSKLLNDLVRNQILAQIAMERGLDKNADIVKALKEAKTTLLASKIVDDIDKKTAVTSAEVQAFYDKNKELLRKPEERKIREIVLKSEFDAKDIIVKVMQGQDFAELAKASSIGDTKDKSGDLGFVAPGAIDRPLKFWEEAFKNLEKGETSRFIKGDDGKFYVIKVEDIKSSELIPLTGDIPLADGSTVKVDAQLKSGLKVEKLQNEINRLVGDYKSRSKVEIKEDLLK